MEWVDHFKEGPKTALANQVFKSSGVTGQDSIVLFGDRNVEKELELFNLKMSLRNIPNVYTSTLSQLNGLDLLRNKNVFIVVSDLSELETYLNA
jgi:ribosomal protein L4